MKAPIGALNKRESARSNAPPIPGIIAPESLTFALRLNTDSIKSEQIAVAPITKPNVATNNGAIFLLKI